MGVELILPENRKEDRGEFGVFWREVVCFLFSAPRSLMVVSVDSGARLPTLGSQLC